MSRRGNGDDRREAAMQATDLLADSEPVLKDWMMKRNCSSRRGSS